MYKLSGALGAALLGLLCAVPAQALQAPLGWGAVAESRGRDLRQPGRAGMYGPVDFVRARVWVDDDRDFFRRGDRMRVRFSTSEDAYVAVVHIDTDGNLEFLYPSSPWDQGFVRGGREHTLPRTGASAGWGVRGSPGIGYLYVIAAPVPLDFGYFQAGRGGLWDWSYAGRTVRGDPFWALQQMTRLLLPDRGYVPYAADHYTYYLEGRHRYPAYACAPWGAHGGWGWSSGFGSCDRLDLFVRQNPYYFDARRFRGDRRHVWARYDSLDPRPNLRNAPGRAGPATLPPRRGDDPQPPRAAPAAPTPRTAQPREPERRQPERSEPAPEARPERRPSLDRRGGGAGAGEERAGAATRGEASGERRGGSSDERRARPRPRPSGGGEA
jgi:hypothetical protein